MLSKSPVAATAPMRLAQTIVVGNLKGGTGKSTITVNLAAALVEYGVDVAILDTDPQGTATEWATHGRLPIRCFHEPLHDLNATGRWTVVARELLERHDVVLIDLPAVVAPALAMAYLVADVILIPTAPTEIDIVATRRVLRYIAAALRERPDNPPSVFVVPSRVDTGARSENLLLGRLAVLGQPLAPPIRLHAEHDRAFIERSWVGAVAPGSLAHKEVLLLASTVADAMVELRQAPLPRMVERPSAPLAIGSIDIDLRKNHRYLDELPAAARVRPRYRPAWWKRLVGQY